MVGPLTGVRVVEVANFIAVPAATALLSDMGATVIKVEAPTGDALRTLRLGGDAQTPTYLFQVENHGKRSITVNLDHPDGRAIVQRLAAQADVLLTNLTVLRAARYGLTYPMLAAANPRLIVAQVTGYGPEGPDRDRMGFDLNGFWARSGLLSALSDAAGVPPFPRPGWGDRATAALVVSGVVAALYERERSGQGQALQFSLLHAGLWVAAREVQLCIVSGEELPVWERTNPPNPLVNTYCCSDGAWLVLFMNPPDRYWPGVCAALGRPELADDARYSTLAARAEHTREVVALLEAAFATAARAEWGRRLDAQGAIWAPVQTLTEVVADPQARANGYFTPLTHPSLGTFEMVDTPLRFGRTPASPHDGAPELGQHTEEVLLELGYSWQEIGTLRDGGAL